MPGFGRFNLARLIRLAIIEHWIRLIGSQPGGGPEVVQGAAFFPRQQNPADHGTAIFGHQSLH